MLLPVTCRPSAAALSALAEIPSVPRRDIVARRLGPGRSEWASLAAYPCANIMLCAAWEQARVLAPVPFCQSRLRLLIQQRPPGMHRLLISICRLHSSAGGNNLQELRN